MSSQDRRASGGRPRAFDKEGVLDSAMHLFWKKGFRATTTRDLETTLGLSQSSLYNAFGSKQQLYQEALDRYEAQLTATLLAPLDEGEPGIDAVLRFLDALGAWLRRNGQSGCMVINLMAGGADDGEVVARRAKAYRARLRRRFRRALSGAAHADRMDSRDVTLRADLLLSLVLGLNIAARGGARGRELSAMIAAAKATVASWPA